MSDNNKSAKAGEILAMAGVLAAVLAAVVGLAYLMAAAGRLGVFRVLGPLGVGAVLAWAVWCLVDDLFNR